MDPILSQNVGTNFNKSFMDMRYVNGTEKTIRTNSLELAVLLFSKARNDLNDPKPDILSDKISGSIDEPHDYINIEEDVLSKFLSQDNDLQH